MEWAREIAQEEPAGPAPMMTTSHSSTLTLPFVKVGQPGEVLLAGHSMRYDRLSQMTTRFNLIGVIGLSIDELECATIQIPANPGSRNLTD